MQCLQCAEDNPPAVRRCQYCLAPLIPVIPDEPASGLGIKEGVVYPEPTHHYETDQLLAVQQLVDRLLEGDDCFDDLEDQLDQMAHNFALFEALHVNEMQRLLAQESQRLPADDFNNQLSYVIKTGLGLFGEGRRAFKVFFENESEDAEELEAAFLRVRDGNDYLCLALEMAHQRHQDLLDVIDHHPDNQEDPGETFT